MQDSLNSRKSTLIGCKMKIYQERMRMTSFMEVIQSYRQEGDLFI